jgi:hypothetical protein
MVDEAALFAQTRTVEPLLTFEDLTPAALSRLTERHGIDFTTALLYDRLRLSVQHGPFIQEVESRHVDLLRTPKMQGRMIVVPASFYQEFPNFGGGGDVLMQIGQRHGLDCEIAPTDGAGRLTANAEVMRRVLSEAEDNSLYLFTLSRGAAEVRLALLQDPRLVRKIRKWITVSGLIFGCHHADVMLSFPKWKQFFVYRSLKAYGLTPEIVAELQTAPGGILERPFRVDLPEGKMICVVPLCLRSHLNTGGQRRRFDGLKKYGPNDGIMTYVDGVHHQAKIFPVWGADHYMRVPATAFMFYRLFGYLAAEQRRELAGDKPLASVPELNLGPNRFL